MREEDWMISAHGVEVIAGWMSLFRQQRIVVPVADYPLTRLQLLFGNVIGEYFLEGCDVGRRSDRRR